MQIYLRPAILLERSCDEQQTVAARVETGHSALMPEVDDEVLVVFGHGDVRNPAVVGELWRAKDEPPEQDTPARSCRAGSDAD